MRILKDHFIGKETAVFIDNIGVSFNRVNGTSRSSDLAALALLIIFFEQRPDNFPAGDSRRRRLLH